MHSVGRAGQPAQLTPRAFGAGRPVPCFPCESMLTERRGNACLVSVAPSGLEIIGRRSGGSLALTPGYLLPAPSVAEQLKQHTLREQQVARPTMLAHGSPAEIQIPRQCRGLPFARAEIHSCAAEQPRLAVHGRKPRTSCGDLMFRAVRAYGLRKHVWCHGLPRSGWPCRQLQGG